MGVREVADGLVRASGLERAMLGELVELAGGARGVVVALESDGAAIAMLDACASAMGQSVTATGRRVEADVFIGAPGRGVPVDARAPNVCERDYLSEPLIAGVKAVDALLPLKRGMRVAVLGEAGTGKTDLLTTIVMAQRGSGVACVFAAVGWRAAVLESLARSIPHATIVSAADDAPPARQMLVPAAAMAVAEQERDRGRDVLVVIDEMGAHEDAFRRVVGARDRVAPASILPAEVFSEQARVLERAGRFARGGTITVIAAVEVPRGADLARSPGIIPIVERPWLLDADAFRGGRRPALTPPVSTSKLAGDTVRVLRRIAGGLRLDIAQYREIVGHAAGATKLDRATTEALRRGERVLEVMRQRASTPMRLEHQVAVFLAARSGVLDGMAVGQVQAFEERLIARLGTLALDARRDLDETTSAELLRIAREVAGG